MLGRRCCSLGVVPGTYLRGAGLAEASTTPRWEPAATRRAAGRRENCGLVAALGVQGSKGPTADSGQQKREATFNFGAWA